MSVQEGLAASAVDGQDVLIFAPERHPAWPHGAAFRPPRFVRALDRATHGLIVLMNQSEMCRALAGHLRTLITLADLYRPAEVRQTGSRANLELAEDAALAHEAWGSTPVRFAQQDPSLRIAAHLDHVCAFAERVQDDIVTPFALESIARGGIECAARVAWL